MSLSEYFRRWRNRWPLALVKPRHRGAPEGAVADCAAVRGMREVDQQVMAQLGRAVGMSEQSAMSLIEQVSGLRQRSASLIHYLDQAHIQSEAMQGGIELNSRIIGELASFVRTLPQQIASERTHFQQLMAEVKKLSDMTDTIRGIARQTEILAINAAIEAARAGEAGRGFAVLAGEMRHLATQSNASATRVNHDVQSLMKNVEVSYSGEFETRTRHNEAEAERLGHLTLELDESYVDMRQFYQMLMTAVSEHNTELDRGIAALLDTAQYQDIFKQIIDRAQPALDSRHTVMAELIRRLRAGERNTEKVDAEAQALASDYLAREAAHHRPEPVAGGSLDDPGESVVFF